MTTEKAREDYVRKLFEAENPNGITSQNDIDFYNQISCTTDLIWLAGQMESAAWDWKLKNEKNFNSARWDELVRKINIVKESEKTINRIAFQILDRDATIASLRRMVALLQERLPHVKYTPEHLIINFINPERL